MTQLDPEYWSNHFKQVFCKQITTLIDSIANRVLPTFDQLESEADDVAQREFERLGRIGSEESDMGDCAERAYEAGVDYYQSLEAVRQSLINISVAALYHLFEQQIFLFLRKQVLHPEEDKNKLINMKEFEKRLNSFDISIDTLTTWSKIKELEVVANVIKHAEGRSADGLRSLRPDLFNHPAILKNPIFDLGIRTLHVYMPLAGEDIYLSIDDLRAYCSALVSFWQEFANAIQ